MAYTIGKTDIVSDRNNFDYEEILTASTSTINLYSSDIGQLLLSSSNQVQNLSASTAPLFRGIFAGNAAGVTVTTGGSTSRVYVRPITPYMELEMTFSTAASATLPATTDLGKWCGFSSNTTSIGVLGMDTLAAAWNAADFFRITGFNVDNRTVRGKIGEQSIFGYTS